MVIASAAWRSAASRSPAGLGVPGQVGQGLGELGEVVAVAEAPGRGRQVLPGGGGVPGGQGQAAQQPVTPGHSSFQPFLRQMSALRRVSAWAGPGRPVRASHSAHQIPRTEYR